MKLTKNDFSFIFPYQTQNNDQKCQNNLFHDFGCNLELILHKILQISKSFILLLPWSSRMEGFPELISKASMNLKLDTYIFEIEQIFVDDYLQYIAVHYGSSNIITKQQERQYIVDQLFTNNNKENEIVKEQLVELLNFVCLKSGMKKLMESMLTSKAQTNDQVKYFLGLISQYKCIQNPEICSLFMSCLQQNKQNDPIIFKQNNIQIKQNNTQMFKSDEKTFQMQNQIANSFNQVIALSDIHKDEDQSIENKIIPYSSYDSSYDERINIDESQIYNINEIRDHINKSRSQILQNLPKLDCGSKSFKFLKKQNQ